MYAIQSIEPQLRPVAPWPAPSGPPVASGRRPLSLSEWLSGFRELHERARAGELDAAALEQYRESRAELGHALLVAQQISHQAGLAQRREIRVAWALQLDLEVGCGRVRAVTLDVSSGGFALLLGAALPEAVQVPFELRLPGGHRVRGTARVVDTVEGPAHHRASFAFADVPADDRERLEQFLFDKILERLA